jgi:hypothetical protein
MAAFEATIRVEDEFLDPGDEDAVRTMLEDRLIHTLSNYGRFDKVDIGPVTVVTDE